MRSEILKLQEEVLNDYRNLKWIKDNSGDARAFDQTFRGDDIDKLLGKGSIGRFMAGFARWSLFKESKLDNEIVNQVINIIEDEELYTSLRSSISSFRKVDQLNDEKYIELVKFITTSNELADRISKLGLKTGPKLYANIALYLDDA